MKINELLKHLNLFDAYFGAIFTVMWRQLGEDNQYPSMTVGAECLSSSGVAGWRGGGDGFGYQ